MRTLILCAIVLITIGCAESTDTEGSVVELGLEWENTAVSTGDSANLLISIDENPVSFFGISLQLAYDDEFLESEGENYLSGEIFGEESLSFIQSSEGIIHLTGVCEQGSNISQSTGILGTIEFNTLADGITEVEILSDKIAFYDEEGNIIDLDFSINSEAVLEID